MREYTFNDINDMVLKLEKTDNTIAKIKELRDYWDNPERGKLDGVDAFNIVLKLLGEE